MFGLARLFVAPRIKKAARSLHEAIAAQAREPALYAQMGVPDTLDGRFEMIALHTFLVLRRLRVDPSDDARRLAQEVFDRVFLEFDADFREHGIGDTGVGKRVRKMAEGVLGRVAAYERALPPDGAAGDPAADLDGGRGEFEPERTLQTVLIRNVFAGGQPDPAQLASLAAYVRERMAHLSSLPIEPVLGGRIDFGAMDKAEGGTRDREAAE